MSEPHIRKNPPADGSTMSISDIGLASRTPTPRPAGQIEIAAPLEEGSRIGPYEVREHIGDGGMAAVYKVWHTGLHRFEALKIPRYQAQRGPEADFLHRLLAEARTAASLQHPNIVAIHNVSDEKSILHYFAMEFVSGNDLATFIADGPLPFQQALSILQQIGSALDYAHEHGVIHRDIKPANILLEQTESGPRARVVDFGISRAGEDDGSTRLTRSGMIVGTPEYMSPEQSGSGAAVDHRTDIYSLGIVAYEMLCGDPPFVAGDGVSRMSVLMKQINEVPPSLDQCRPDLSPVAAQAVAKALAKNPDERFSSCSAFINSLSAAPPLAEQQTVVLSNGKKPRRGTVGALFGTPTLTPNDGAHTLSLGQQTAQFTAQFIAPLPAKIARAVTSPISLILASVAAIAAAFVVWDMRKTATPTLRPNPTPKVIAPLIPQPKPTRKPNIQKSNPTPLKKVSAPVAANPVATKPATKPAAKPLQKPAPQPAPRVIVRETAPSPIAKKPAKRRVAIRKPIVRKPIVRKPITRKVVVRRASRPVVRRSAPIRRSYSGGGEAGLPP